VVKTSGAQRNTFLRQPYAWLGAGALGVGLALAGAGTAHADDAVSDAASTAAASSTRAQGNAAAGAAAKSTSRSPVATSRPAGPRDSVKDGAGKRALTAANRSTLAVTPRVRSAVPVSAAASATAVVQSEAGDRPLGRTVVRAAAARAAAAQAAVTPAEAINAAVVDWFDSTSASLATLPRGPLNELASGALMLVRRSLFNQLPSASPAQLFTDAAGQVSGSIGASDPEGDALTYRLVQAPEFGLVQIAADGTYTYVPGSDYSGSDTFVVGVSDSGFNLLNPSGSRTTDVAVQVPDESLIGPPVGVSRGFNLTNLSGQAVYLAAIQKEAGYADSVESAPSIGSVLQPGESAHFETTYYYFYTYDTRAIWKSCTDTSCASVTPGNQQWTVRLHTWSGQVWDSNGPTTINCEKGDCSYDRDGQAVSNPLDGANRAFLLDSPGTVNTLSAGTQADKIARVLEQLCDSNNSASCSFKPKTFQQTQTPWYLALSFTNKTNVQVTQALARNQTTSTQTSLKLSENAKLNLFKIVEAGITRETTETWTTQTTWTETYTVPIPSGETGYLYYRDPIKRVTGDFTATIGNTKWLLTDVNFDTPDPDITRPDGGRAVYQATNSPVTPTV
jgi:hypothetical protein